MERYATQSESEEAILYNPLSLRTSLCSPPFRFFFFSSEDAGRHLQDDGGIR